MSEQLGGGGKGHADTPPTWQFEQLSLVSHDQVDAAAGAAGAGMERPAAQSTGATGSPTGGVRYGKCKWFNVAKGWGFITPNDGGKEVFVHQSVIQMAGFRSLGEQEEVEFECQVTERGLEATRVSGSQGHDCHGSTFRPRSKKRYRRIRCYNCGAFANHIAAKCELGPQPKSCHLCKGRDHLFADCPQRKTETSANTSGSQLEGRTSDDADGDGDGDGDGGGDGDGDGDDNAPLGGGTTGDGDGAADESADSVGEDKQGAAVRS